MATRNPADTSQVNFKGCDWYEPYRGWTAQKKVFCPAALNSAQIYGHDTWDPSGGGSLVDVAPILVTYPS